MPETSNSDGLAEHASVGYQTPDEQRNREYLAQVADEAEAAVESVKKMIEHLQDSLEERTAAARAARAEANKE